MSWFSRVTLDAQNRSEKQRLQMLRDQPYAQHQALWQLFDRPAGMEQPFVFREIAQDADDVLQILLVSDAKPAANADGWRIESKSYEPQLRADARFRFSLRLNPTRSEKRPDGRGKRQDYVISRLHELDVPREQRPQERQRIVHEELPQWLRTRSEVRGFAVETALVERHEVLRIHKRGQDVTLAVADFSGVLRVSDASLLTESLRHGIGHGRSFGMGMLLLKPC